MTSPPRALRTLAASVLLAGFAAGPAAAAGIHVLTAWYGPSCHTQHGNVTAHVKSRCDGKAACSYTVDAGTLGDPAPGCAKNFLVLYTCPGQAEVRLAQMPAEAHGKAIQFACEVKRPPAQPTS
jgi:hypothetical protein